MSLKDKYKALSNDRPYAKIGIDGMAGSGKSYTAVEIAIGIHKERKCENEILCFLTNNDPGIQLLDWFFAENGIEAVFIKSDSLSDLGQAIRDAEEAQTPLIIDSITHVWKQFQDDYIDQRNEVKSRKLGFPVKSRDVNFPDWKEIKPKWEKEFNDLFVQARTDIIMCGRASYEYDFQSLNGEGSKKELVKTGIKMMTEKNTAFEPDINIEMRMQRIFDGDKTIEVYREGFIKKDRTTKVDGMTFKNPTYAAIRPAFLSIMSGSKMVIQHRTKPNKFDISDGDGSKKIVLEKIQAEFDRMKFGTSKDDKAAKVEVMKAIFSTTSAEEIGKMKTTELESSLIDCEAFGNWYIDACNTAQAEGNKPPTIEAMKSKLDELRKKP